MLCETRLSNEMKVAYSKEKYILDEFVGKHHIHYP